MSLRRAAPDTEASIHQGQRTRLPKVRTGGNDSNYPPPKWNDFELEINEYNISSRGVLKRSIKGFIPFSKIPKMDLITVGAFISAVFRHFVGQALQNVGYSDVSRSHFLNKIAIVRTFS